MAFSCDHCHKTWPDRKNRGDPTLGEPDICPECAEDEEEEDGRQFGPWNPRSGNR